MLIIREGICYVNSENLNRYPIPSSVRLDRDYNEEDFVSFIDPITILYFKAREDMLNYDEVSVLNEIELDTLIYGIRSKLEDIGKELLSESSYRRNALFCTIITLWN